MGKEPGQDSNGFWGRFRLTNATFVTAPSVTESPILRLNGHERLNAYDQLALDLANATNNVGDAGKHPVKYIVDVHLKDPAIHRHKADRMAEALLNDYKTSAVLHAGSGAVVFYEKPSEKFPLGRYKPDYEAPNDR